jgi:hypothetical protein
MENLFLKFMRNHLIIQDLFLKLKTEPSSETHVEPPTEPSYFEPHAEPAPTLSKSHVEPPPET